MKTTLKADGDGTKTSQFNNLLKLTNNKAIFMCVYNSNSFLIVFEHMFTI